MECLHLREVQDTGPPEVVEDLDKFVRPGRTAVVNLTSSRHVIVSWCNVRQEQIEEAIPARSPTPIALFSALTPPSGF
jgi:hypothetical protein